MDNNTIPLEHFLVSLLQFLYIYVIVGIVKNILVLLLAIRILIPGAVLHCFGHLDDYYEHFQLHKAEKKEVSLLSFIAEHLGSENHTHKNKEAHDDLPFHHQHSSESSPTLTCCAICTNVDFRGHVPDMSTLKIAFKQHFYNSAYLKAIWQPPKLG